VGAAHAEAGTYHVVACSNLGSTSAALPNNAWTQVPAKAPTGLEAFVACPSMRGDRRDGIAAEDHVPGPSKVDAGAEVFWRFAAPPGTSIAEISVARSLGKASDQSWRPYGRADGAVFDTCDIASGHDLCENTGNATFAINNASTIDYGVRCDAPSGQCATGSSLHNVWMSLYAADVCRTAPEVHARDRRSTAAARMRDANVDVALVMDGDRLVGIVTSTDLVRSIAADVAAASPTHPDRIRDVGPAESGQEPLTSGPASGRR